MSFPTTETFSQFQYQPSDRSYKNNNNYDEDEVSGEKQHQSGRFERVVAEPATITNIHKNDLTTYLAKRLDYLGELCYETIGNVILSSPKILLSSGVAFTVQYFDLPSKLQLSTFDQSGLTGAFSIGKFVGLTVLLQTALSPFINKILIESYNNRVQEQDVLKTKIQDYAVKFLTPMTLAVIISYKKGIPVDAAKQMVYTAGIFGLMKILDKGYDTALRWYSSLKERD